MGTIGEVAGKADSILAKVQVIVSSLGTATEALTTLDAKLDEIRTFIESLQGGSTDQAAIDQALNSLTAAEGVVDGLSATVSDVVERTQARVAETDTLDGTP